MTHLSDTTFSFLHLLCSWLAQWLLDNDVKTVGMESTGTYWQALFAALQAEGLQVILCNGKFTKNIKGRKTDVQYCQWIASRSCRHYTKDAEVFAVA